MPEATREFRRQIFMGDGARSQRLGLLLKLRVEQGLTQLSGQQQGPRDSDEFEEAQRFIEGVVLDVATALGVKVKIEGELPHGEAQ